MYPFSPKLGAVVAAFLSTTLAASPDDGIPEQWRQDIPLIWDANLARTAEGLGMNISSTDNWTLDPSMDDHGTINTCMRWDSNQTLTLNERKQLEQAHNQHIQDWAKWLPGWDSFPFSDVKVNVVGWAVRNKALLEGSTDGFEVYAGFYDDDGKATCDPACSRELHQNGDYTGCPGGVHGRYHQHLLLNPGWGDFNMGAASSPGVDISMYGWETIGRLGKDWPMLTHELGHTFGIYDLLSDGARPANRTFCNILWLPKDAPQDFVMKPGDGGFDMAPQLTDFEGWVLRHWWSRFSRMRGWTRDDFTWPIHHCDKLTDDSPVAPGSVGQKVKV